MKTHNWEDIAARRFSPEARAKQKKAAKAELERVGLAALRKAREQTQVELAQEMGIPQSGVSDIERRTDLLLTTLRKYIQALGGELEVTAKFPEAEFAIDVFGGEPIPKAKQAQTDRSLAATA